MSNLNLIGATEVAKILGISRGTVHTWIHAGKVPVVGTIGSRNVYAFDRAAVEEVAKKRGRNNGND